MTIAGIDLRYLVKEISKRTAGYYVSNIYGVSRDSLLFKLHHPEKPDILLMFSTLGLWITSVKIEQLEENRLVKRLRNDLLRSKISEVKQVGAERIVYLTFSGIDKELILVGEFFADGNIILCDKEMKIRALLHSIEVRHRTLRVGLRYEPPPQSGLDIFHLTLKDFPDISSISTPTVRWIGRTLGLPSKYAEEIVYRSKVGPQIPVSSLSNKDIENILGVTKNLIENIIEGNHEAIVIRNTTESDISPIILGHVDKSKCTKISSFMAGLDMFFKENLLHGKSSQTNTVNQKIEELEHKLEEQIKAISLVKKRVVTISGVARSMLDLASKGVQTINDPAISNMLESKNSSLAKERGILLVNIDGEKIKINQDSSIQAIASVLFNESKKQLKAIESIESIKKKTEKSLENFRKQADIARDSVVFTVQKKREWYERYRWFFTSDGLLAIGGRDASSNSSVIRKHLEKNDKVFHAEIYGSPFFILKNSMESPPNSIVETAQATVCFSRAWREGLFGLN
ncbi:MAG: NFACT family protein, partial [Thaumarchaeota archaeon]|nr:NFACT family protein [Nitrososphaerota archaeon]